MFHFVFVFFLPYLQIGITFHDYKFALCDFFLFLSLLCNLLYFIVTDSLKINKVYLYFLSLFLLLINAFLLSFFKVISPDIFFIEILPYIYIFFVILNFSSLYFLGKRILIEYTIKTYIFSAFLSTIPALFWMRGISLSEAFWISAGKYGYLCPVSNQYAIYLVCGLLLLLLKKSSTPKTNIIERLFPFAAIPAILLSASRTATISLLLILAYDFFQGARKSKFLSGRRRQAMLMLKLCLFIILAVYLMTHFGYAKKAISVFKLSGFRDSFREAQFKGAIKTFKEYPILGIGLGQFKVLTGWEVHSSFLSLLVELGIIGFLAFVFLQIFIIRQILTSKKSKRYHIVGLFALFIIYIMMSLAHILRERWINVLFLILVGYFKVYNEPKDLPENSPGP